MENFTENFYYSSISWIELKNFNKIKIHSHDYKTVFIVNSGTGQLTGDLESPFKENCVILIPEHCLHGFRAIEDKGFTAVSLTATRFVQNRRHSNT